MSDLSHLPAGYHSVTPYLLTADVGKPLDQFYGHRSGGGLAPFGNQWWFAPRNEEVSSEELAKRMREVRGQ